MSGDRMIDFEESNYDWLVEKFLNIKSVRDLWDDFIYNEYNDSLKDTEPPEEDR